MTRAGLATNGVLHLVVAWLALRVAFGGTERADQGGALEAVAAQPFGRVLLWSAGAGFAAVVVWRTRESLWGFRYVRDERQRTTKRLFSALQAVVFGLLASLAAHVAIGAGPGSGGEGLTAAVLRLPAGRPFLVVIGVGVMVAAVVMGYRGWKKSFTQDMNLDAAGPRARTVAERAGQVGSVAKAVAIAVVGGLVVVAAVTYRPERAEGLDAALKTIAAQPFGPWLLLVVAAGFASFAVFCFFDARYHRV
jgi:hypothetical protein